MRYRDNAPVPHTCPKINDVIDFIKSIDWDLEDEDEANFAYEAKNALNVMEEIRSANDALRTWGNELCQEKDDLEGERDDLNKIIEDLQSEKARLQSELDELTDEVNTLQDYIYNKETHD